MRRVQPLIDVSHPIIKISWKLILVINLVLILAMLASGVLKFMAFQGDEDAFSQEFENYKEKQLADLLPGMSVVLLKQFDLDEEDSFANWFSSMQLFLCAALAFIVFESIGRKNLSKKDYLWIIFGLGIMLVSVEEIAAIHEKIGAALSGGSQIDAGPFTWRGNSAWVIIYGLPIIVGLLTLAWWVVRVTGNSPKARNSILLAIGMWLLVLPLESLMYSFPPALLRFEFFLEESLELMGTVLFMRGFYLLQYANAMKRREAGEMIAES